MKGRRGLVVTTLATAVASAVVLFAATRNWDAINARFPSNSIVRMIEGITGLADEAVAADVQAFFAEHSVPQGTKQLAQHLERQRATVALKRREGEALAAGLKS